MNTIERFEDKYVPEPNSGCWLWTGAYDSYGYGRFRMNGKKLQAHRASWGFYKGNIPKGKCVLHKCDTPRCVNPDHLYIGTLAQNTRDMFSKGREHDRRGEKHGRAKLAEKDVLKIRSDGGMQRLIAEEYGVSQLQISGIKHKKLWRHI